MLWAGSRQVSVWSGLDRLDDCVAMMPVVGTWGSVYDDSNPAQLSVLLEGLAASSEQLRSADGHVEEFII